jgi:hypothetical protein
VAAPVASAGEFPELFPMPASLLSLTDRALEIRAHFNATAVADGRRPWTSTELAQGFAADVGALNKLIMMRAGLRNAPPDIDARLAHELADCLWSVLVLAHEHGVHLEAAFSRTMAEIQRTGPAAPASGKC